jgi:hypothetical protein
MQVTVEGVVKSDVCERGQRLVVEYTSLVRTLAQNGLVKVVDWNHPEPQKSTEVDDELTSPNPPKRRRMTKPADTDYAIVPHEDTVDG